MTTKSSKVDALRKALLNLGFNLPELRYIERESLSVSQPVRTHEIDRTPLLFDPDLGPGEGVRKKCSDSTGLDVGGKAVTDNAGRLLWKLTDFICEGDGLSVSEPASFVATARSKSPVFLTSRTISTGDDLVIDVFSWDTSGNPAPKVGFAWRCWIEVDEPAPPVID